ncbi:MAG: hypothetical protein ILO36_08570 [Abditibacteriota bacterium]|nr:hypothetical protein [Abditibacteriota bacterium]
MKKTFKNAKSLSADLLAFLLVAVSFPAGLEYRAGNPVPGRIWAAAFFAAVLVCGVIALRDVLRNAKEYRIPEKEAASASPAPVFVSLRREERRKAG